MKAERVACRRSTISSSTSPYQMAVSLKDINRPALVFVVVANVVGYYFALEAGTELPVFSAFVAEYQRLLPSAALALVVGILNALLNHANKARLVFLRWQHPLPGCYAFSKIMEKDSRVDVNALRRLADPLPVDPIEQNRLWFKWYREVQDEQAVRQVHREYLFARDWTGLSVLLAVVLCPLAFKQMELPAALLFTLAMVLQYCLVRIAARNHGERFVASVLAYKAAPKF